MMMPGSTLHEDSSFFIQAGALCTRTPVTCPPDTTVVDLARLMQKHNISGVIVSDDEIPQGVVTLRDLRNLVATAPESLHTQTVADIMHPGLITIGNRIISSRPSSPWPDTTFIVWL